ncbi:endonuclease/exonuclease/phosphatase family protein [Marivita sp.]|uniref:endonuclease/exonuclease/phosphatase family protein n=1 Tax=Marivita sp. TaxID=2003365 RepID=UPI0025C71784|nr:endonuclease/exonuclease/phosphatase family protein [Marivita sp.]
MALSVFANSVAAQDLRLALWHVPLSRKGPGLLLRDLQRKEPSLMAIAQALRSADADIIVLTKMDYDATGAAVTELSKMVDGGYTDVLPLRSNAGLPTGLDLDGDGRLGEPEDTQAFGWFPGQEALAVLSRFSLLRSEIRSFNELLWRDIPGSHAEQVDSGLGVQRLSSGGHWVVPVRVPTNAGGDRVLTLLIGHAGPPVFDGPEDRNGRRNLDELRLWQQIMHGAQGPAPEPPFAFMANTNLDPERGEGNRSAMAEFLADPRVQDPLPGQITAEWDRPGPMRVSYLLPSSDVGVRAAAVWPSLPEEQHRLITLDITLPNRPSP